MKIAVNTRLLIKNKLEGIGWFTYESLKRIVLSHPEHEFYFIFDRAYDEEFIFSKNVHPIVIGPQARHPLLFYIWFEFSVTKALKKIKPDLFISPDAYLSLAAKVKTLLVIHDLNFEHYPNFVPWAARKHFRYFTPRFAKKADRIATVSEFSKKDIVEQYHINPNKIDVVYNGSNNIFNPISEDEKLRVRKQYCQGKRYFLFIGALNPRKNLSNLFRAYDIYRSFADSDAKLLIVGEKMYWSKEIRSAYEKMKFKADVLFTGRIEPFDLNRVINAAIALTYVSIFEGFGIPIIEAFNCETPVITSNVSSMPEIAGEAAILVNPFDPQNIAEAMKLIEKDLNLRKNLIAKGKERSKHFSWDYTAAELWTSVIKTLNK